MDTEYTDTPPPGMSYQQWVNECCCACYGCPDCEHDCDRSPQEREERARHYNEAFRAILENPDAEEITLSDGSVLRPTNRPPGAIKKLVLPTILNHIEYPDDLAERGLLES